MFTRTHNYLKSEEDNLPSLTNEAQCCDNKDWALYGDSAGLKDFRLEGL